MAAGVPGSINFGDELTGELAVAYLKGDATKFFSFALPGPGAPADLRWAVAGRNRDKLEKLGASEVIVCESEDEAAINRMVGRTKVVVGFAGPFIKYSDRVVAACARLGTHWVDITGEAHPIHTPIPQFHTPPNPV